MSILCELRLCCFPSNTPVSKLIERNQQFVNGLNKFFEYLPFFNENQVTLFITDNTISNDKSIPDEILKVIPENVKIRTCLNNKYGCYNKGAGVIEQWLYNKNFIKEYEWIIYFEPRQLLKSNQFIDNFVKNPRNLFTINNNVQHFNTGLFCIQTKIIMQYITSCNLNEMVSKRICIEDDLYKYFIKNKIPFDLLDKMDLIWFPNNHIPLHY